VKIRLPKRENILETSAADPLKFYYLPVARSFYLARFADAIRLLTEGVGRVGTLLDVGCGSGIFTPELSAHCDRLIACDYHPNLALTAGMLRSESVEASLVRLDATRLPYADETMDAICSMSVFEHIHDLDSVASECHRVLKPGGAAVVGVPVTNLMTEAMLRMSYLSLDAKLDDEHVSTHRDVIRAFSKVFKLERRLDIPRLMPEMLSMYTTVRFRKS